MPVSEADVWDSFEDIPLLNLTRTLFGTNNPANKITVSRPSDDTIAIATPVLNETFGIPFKIFRDTIGIEMYPLVFS